MADHEWHHRAACQGERTALFFAYDLDVQEEAKRICRTCPVRRECLRDALDRRDRYGIWGGFNPQERKKLQRRETRTGVAVA